MIGKTLNISTSIFKKKLPDKVFLILIIAIHIILSISNCELWIDEASSLIAARMPFIQTLHQAITFEAQAPLYYLLLHIWLWPLKSIFYARIFSLIFSMASIPIVYKILKSLGLNSIMTLFLTLIFATNPFIIFSSCTIRYYSLSIFLSALLFLLFNKIYVNNHLVLRARILFITLSLVAVYVQYYLAFLLLTFGISLISIRKPRMFFSYVIDMIVPVIGTIILIMYIPTQIDTYTLYIKVDSGILKGISFLLHRFENYFVNLTNVYDNKMTQNIFRILLFTLIIIIIWKYKIYKYFVERNWKTLLTINILLVTIFFILYQIFGSDLLFPWHTLTMFIPAFILISMILCIRPNLPGILILVFFLWNNFTLIYKGMNKPVIREYSLSSEYITRHEKQHQPVFLFRNELELIYRFYYHGMNKLCPLPSKIDFDRGYNHLLWIPRDKNQIDSAFNAEIDENTRNFWLITQVSKTKIYNLNYHPEILENYLRLNYTLLRDTIIGDIKVRFYKIPFISDSNLSKRNPTN